MMDSAAPAYEASALVNGSVGSARGFIFEVAFHVHIVKSTTIGARLLALGPY